MTGFLRSDVDSLAEAARRVGERDPRACRDRVHASFDEAVMTSRYEAATADGSAAPARS